MFGFAKHASQLTRMEAARRQTQHQLELIDRQITRRMTALLPLLGRRHAATVEASRQSQLLSSNATGRTWRR